MLWFSYRIWSHPYIYAIIWLGCFMFIHGVIEALWHPGYCLIAWFISLICLFGDIIKRGRMNYLIMGEFWNSENHLNLIYMLMFISFQTRYVTWYLLCLMCVGTSFDNPMLHTLMRKALRFLKIRRTNDAALVICTTFSFWVHGRVDLYRHFDSR